MFGLKKAGDLVKTALDAKNAQKAAFALKFQLDINSLFFTLKFQNLTINWRTVMKEGITPEKIKQEIDKVKKVFK